MCAPVSVVTGGRISGCQMLCQVWPHIGGMVALGAMLVWNFARGIFPKKPETAN